MRQLLVQSVFYEGWQVSQEQNTFVGSKLVPVLIWAFHSAVAGDNWVFNVPREVPHFGFLVGTRPGIWFGLGAPFQMSLKWMRTKRCWLFSFPADHNFSRGQGLDKQSCLREGCLCSSVQDRAWREETTGGMARCENDSKSTQSWELAEGPGGSHWGPRGIGGNGSEPLWWEWRTASDLASLGDVFPRENFPDKDFHRNALK